MRSPAPMVRSLASPLVVRAADQYGNPISGASIVFTATSGGGSVNPSTAQTTPANGQVQVTATVGTAVGSDVFHAAAGAVGADFTETSTQSPPAGLALTSTNAAAAVNTTETFTVKATDSQSNPVPGVTVVFASTVGGGSANPPSAVTDSNGNASTTITLGQTAGANTFTATAGTLHATLNVTGNAGTASQLVKISGDGQTGEATTQLANPLVVEARDAFNNIVAGFAVTFSVTTGNGSVAVTTAQNTGVELLAASRSMPRWGTAAGSQSFTASGSGVIQCSL